MQERQHVSLERLHNYDEMVRALRQIERQTRGRVSLEVIGQSNEGRDLYLARVGTGATKVLYITQQHGNEPLGTEAALQLLQRAGNGGAGWDAILRQITLLVVPKVNPDGSERFQRENHDPDCAGAFCEPGVGFDVNRWHDPAVPPEANPVPEAAAIQRAFAQHRPAFVVDFHHQGSYVSADGDMITTSIFWPRRLTGMPESAITLSKQVCVVIDDTLAHYGFAEVSQYPGTTPRGIARNAYGLLGAGSVLVEFRGDIGQKSAGMLIRTAFVIMSAVAESVAEGTVYLQDPARADAIPLRGPSVD
ncbi:MAG: M14 family zinc carboxypeptidase, partial [Pseudonocardiaceae bacterium]